MQQTSGLAEERRRRISTAADPAHPLARLAKRIVQVGGHSVLEKVTRPTARTAADIPISGDDVTPEWLTAVLCREHPGARVVDCEVRGGSTGSTTRTAFTVSYNEAGRRAGLPTELFSKSTKTFQQRLNMGMAQVIAGEVGFYAELRPQLDIEAPVGYFAARDARSWRSIVITDDIAVTKGATFCTPTTAISRGRVEDLVDDMATWHGTLWSSPQLVQRTWIRSSATYVRSLGEFIKFRERAQVGAKRAQAVIPEALWSREDALWRGLERATALGEESPDTFLHGDPHVANTYITGEGRMGFGDWQQSLRGIWAFDYSYMLSTALTVDDRRRWERELLARYLERLATAGGPAMSFDDAWLTYRQQMFYTYFAWTFTIGRGPLQPEMQPDEISLPIIQRIANAIVDLSSIEAIGV